MGSSATRVSKPGQIFPFLVARLIESEFLDQKNTCGPGKRLGPLVRTHDDSVHKPVWSKQREYVGSSTQLLAPENSHRKLADQFHVFDSDFWQSEKYAGLRRYAKDKASVWQVRASSRS